MMESDEKGRLGNRAVLLVSTRAGTSFQNIAKAMAIKPESSPPVVNWESEDKRALPSLESRLNFTTHYALCVIPGEVWDDPGLTLGGKFAIAKFWEHPGVEKGTSESSSSRSSVDGNPGIYWSAKLTQTIDSGQEIGRTEMDDDQITQVYDVLLLKWAYTPLYWNCQDFAIRLAYLIIPRCTETTAFLRSLTKKLRSAFLREYPLPSKRLFLAGFFMALGIFNGKPLWVVSTIAVVAVWQWVAFMRPAEAAGRERWKTMRELEGRFPELKALC